MPSLFDSHEEFSEWFSKDIESHAERQSGIDESKTVKTTTATPTCFRDVTSSCFRAPAETAHDLEAIYVATKQDGS